jgi:regulator of nucleoside diphosphate kinase
MEVLAVERTLTELDHTRVSHLLRRHAHGGHDTEHIESTLESARIVPSREIAPDIVTMYSQVLLAFPAGGRNKLTLCYPGDAQPSQGFVSVLSPLGSSLLGLSVGGLAQWRTPLGDEVSAEVLAVTFQPEASGDYTT